LNNLLAIYNFTIYTIAAQSRQYNYTKYSTECQIKKEPIERFFFYSISLMSLKKFKNIRKIIHLIINQIYHQKYTKIITESQVISMSVIFVPKDTFLEIPNIRL